MKRHILFTLALSLAPISVYAVDGTVLINQSTVMAAGGFPYRITQSGSYKLSGNLVATPGLQAILFSANNVALDLNGFTITCSFGVPNALIVTCVGDAGIAGLGVADVSIRNGVVAMTQTAGSTSAIPNFNVAVSLRDSSNLILEDLHIEVASTGNGVSPHSLYFGPHSIVRHNIFSGLGFVDEGCPSLIEGNVNANGGFGTSGGVCVKVNNIGLI